MYYALCTLNYNQYKNIKHTSKTGLPNIYLTVLNGKFLIKNTFL